VKTLDIIGIGEAMVELSAEEPLSQATHLRRSYGGDVLNALIAAARLGARVGFISRVGQDPFGPGLLSSWQAEGVDTRHAPLVEGENGVYFISLQANGEREFTYRRAGSAASRLSPAALDPAYLRQGRVLLLSGITQALSETAQATCLEAARLARGAGLLVAFDPNYRPRLWAPRGGLEAAQTAWSELKPYVDLLLPSHPADLPALALEGKSPPEALQALASQGFRVALKAGPEGAWLAWEGRIHRLPPSPTGAIRDTTGAGDAWNGVFLHGLLLGLSPEEAGARANRAAAQKLGFRGAIPPWPWPQALAAKE
jgi:2-dehydro-3-deoxygluconokinase